MVTPSPALACAVQACLDGLTYLTDEISALGVTLFSANAIDGSLTLWEAAVYGPQNYFVPAQPPEPTKNCSRRFVPADMSAHSTLDRQSFQNLLASAFVVQESLINVQSGSAAVEVLHLIMAGELDVNGAMDAIADRARNVANATGVAIGLLKGDQLVYQAGSGSAATLVGRHVMATLSVSANADTTREILRVDDAQTDPGIGSAICRQFGARSLLILPIYHNRLLAGVLEVVFGEAHAFHDREVSTYQMMARVLGEAMAHAVPFEQKKVLAREGSTTRHAIEQITFEMQRFSSDGGSPANNKPANNKDALSPTCGVVIAEAEEPPARRSRIAEAAKITAGRANRVPSQIGLWRIADRAAVVIVLVTASWIAYTCRRPASRLGASPRQRSNIVEQQVPSVPQKLVAAERDMFKRQTASVPIEQVRRRTPRRVRVGGNEIDYISDDVIVRHFIAKPTLHQVHVPDYQVEQISEDVTVRHFVPKLAIVSPSQTVDHSAASDRSRK